MVANGNIIHIKKIIGNMKCLETLFYKYTRYHMWETLASITKNNLLKNVQKWFWKVFVSRLIWEKFVELTAQSKCLTRFFSVELFA